MQVLTDILNGAAGYVNVARKTFNNFVMVNVPETPQIPNLPTQPVSFPSWITEPFTLFLMGLGFFFSFVYYTNNFVFHATALFYPAIRSSSLINLDPNPITRTRTLDGLIEQLYLRYWFIYAMMTLSSYLTDYLHLIIPFYYHIKFLFIVGLVFSLEKKPEYINEIYSVLISFLRLVFGYLKLR